MSIDKPNSLAHRLMQFDPVEKSEFEQALMRRQAMLQKQAELEQRMLREQQWREEVRREAAGRAKVVAKRPEDAHLAQVATDYIEFLVTQPVEMKLIREAVTFPPAMGADPMDRWRNQRGYFADILEHAQPAPKKVDDQKATTHGDPIYAPIP